MSEENKNGERSEAERDPKNEADAAAVGASADSERDVPSSEPVIEALFEEKDEKDEKKKKKKPLGRIFDKRISISACLISCVALILAAVMLTYTLCATVYKNKISELQINQSRYYPFELFDTILSTYSLQDMDEEAMMAAALKAYVSATGDRYAAYYTDEEYQALMSSNAGDSEGIGINVVNSTVNVGGVEYKAFCVVNVVKDSPAEQGDVRIGDMVWTVGFGESRETVSALGYDVALTKLKGEAGSCAEFHVLRPNENGEYEDIEKSITRAAITTTSVYSHQSAQDPSVGIVKLVQFDLTTPTQFCEAVDTLRAAGCTQFVFDVRYNPGGDLRSIEAVLSYFLNEGDVIIRTKDTTGSETVSRAQAVQYGGDYAGCSVAASDIGKYRGLKAVVLCNGSTASAAELFVATFRDYELGTIVGTTTYGKGSMQSIFSLAQYGYGGALKLTTALYFSAKDQVGYDGVGITPHEVVELSEEAAKKNIYVLTDEEDNQLQAALAALKK